MEFQEFEVATQLKELAHQVYTRAADEATRQVVRERLVPRLKAEAQINACARCAHGAFRLDAELAPVFFHCRIYHPAADLQPVAWCSSAEIDALQDGATLEALPPEFEGRGTTAGEAERQVPQLVERGRAA